MNWKNVAFLISVERKSGRLIRGQRLTHYRENKFVAYAFYLIALGIGSGVGALVGSFYNSLDVLALPILVLIQLMLWSYSSAKSFKVCRLLTYLLKIICSNLAFRCLF